jgi:uncharacterized protein YecA (UPF0149 family)
MRDMNLATLMTIALAFGLDYPAQPKPSALKIDEKLLAPGRNKPCKCGSGLKYKMCCLRQQS